MTFRAVLIGFLEALLLCAVTFFSDRVMRGTFMILHFLPCSVFGALLLMAFVANPLLGRARAAWRLRPAELAVITVIPLMVCALPGGGLFEHFHNVLAMPLHFARIEPGWAGDPPGLEVEDVRDWPALIHGLGPSPTGPGARIRQTMRDALPPATAARMDALAPRSATHDDLKQDVIRALDQLLGEHRLLLAVQASELLPLGGALEAAVRRAGTDSDTAEVRRINRAGIEAAFAGVLEPRTQGTVERLPPGLLPDVSRRNSALVLNGYVNGLGEGDRVLSPAQVPWRAWLPAYRHWLPLVLCLSVGMLGLSLVLHRQWTTHEHLPYPVAQFANAIIGSGGRPGGAGVLGSRVFWGAALAVLLVHMNNYAYAWWPDLFIPIKRRIDFAPLLRVVPWLAQSPVPAGWIGGPTVSLVIVGFAFLLPTQVSLSVGLAPYLFALVTGAMTAYGLNSSTRFGMEPSLVLLCYAGGWCAMFLVVLHNGRRYFASVFARAIAGRRIDHVEPHVAWGARVFLAAMVLFVTLLMVGGMEFLPALLFTGIVVVIQVVASRILAEAGVFHFHPHFFAVTMIWTMLGARAIGPQQLLLLGLFSGVFLANPREALLPFAATALRIAEGARIPLAGVARKGCLVLVLGLLVAGPMTLYLHYQYGALRTGDGWTAVMLPKLPFEAEIRVRQTLDAQGVLSQTEKMGAIGRLRAIRPEPGPLTAFAVTFALVLTFTFLRHRFAWWPFHPVMLLLLATAQSMSSGFSFLLGWLLKAGTVKYGGSAACTRLRPAMLGLIAGEILGSLIPAMIGAVYYFVADKTPPVFHVLR